MKHTLIAFTGLAQAGKTTAASFLENVGYQRLSFAAPLKAMIAVLTRETDKDALPPELCGKTLREAYQSLGTEWARNMIGQDIWINVARARIQEVLASPDIRGVVVDDVRFDNEAELIRSLGGVVIKVNRPNLSAMDHASEFGVSSHLIDAELPSADNPVVLKEVLASALSVM